MSYDINSIETLDFKDAVRARIPMYLGSNDMQGVYNGIQEIISNSIDEFIMGYGDKIEIALKPDNFISVRDYGRGVPFGRRENGENVLEAIYSHAHTGGKFNDKEYQFASGLNGIGAKATCLSSEVFKVFSVRDNTIARIEFHKGNLVSYDESSPTLEPNGTYVEFKPDSKVFTIGDITIDFDKLCETCETLSFLTKGLTFVLRDESKGKVTEVQYHSENGLTDLILRDSDKVINKHPITCSITEDKAQIEIACVWTKGHERSYCFTNGLLNPEGGTPITGIKSAVTRTIGKDVSGISGDLARTGFVYAVNCKVENPSFANQTKTKINNAELRTLATKAFNQGYEEFCQKYPSEKQAIIDFLGREEKAEKAAERARTAVLNAEKEITSNQKKKVLASDKLSDAEFLGQDSTLLIVEGRSAAAAMKVARDVEHYGILAIRGKIINCLSNSDDKIFANEEIKLLLSAMNIVPGKYNSNKLRYGKIAICCDADSDGYHIGLLIMSALQYLAPEFIREKRLCWLRTPLYIVGTGVKEQYFYTDEDFNAIRNTVKGDITRAKGLGALGKERAHRSMFTKEHQRLDVLELDDTAVPMLEELMGEEIEPRRKFVFENIDFSEIRE